MATGYMLTDEPERQGFPVPPGRRASGRGLIQVLADAYRCPDCRVRERRRKGHLEYHMSFCIAHRPLVRGFLPLKVEIDMTVGHEADIYCDHAVAREGTHG